MAAVTGVATRVEPEGEEGNEEEIGEVIGLKSSLALVEVCQEKVRVKNQLSSTYEKIAKKLLTVISDVAGVEEDKDKRCLKVANVHKVAKKIDREGRRYLEAMHVRQPWQQEDFTTKPTWSACRVRSATLLKSSGFEAVMAAAIVFHLLLIIVEADYQAACYPEFYDNLADCPNNVSKVGWLVLINQLLLVVYSVECVLGMYAFRKKYFHNHFSCLDMFVVLTGWITELGIGSIDFSFMKIFRIVRLVRAARLVLSVPELYLLLAGFASSIKAIFFGMLLLAGIIVICSIILVEFVHPVNTQIDHGDCERCPRVFKSVSHASLTIFQQIVAGDGWGSPNVNLIETVPWTAFWLMSILVIIALGIMNLILAVIVESAAESREKDLEQKARTKQSALLSEKVELLQMCTDLDTDCSGTLSLTELEEAWATSKEFRKHLIKLELTKDDVERVHSLMDKDETGEVDYIDFVDELYSIGTCDLRMMVSLCKMDGVQIKAQIEDFVEEKFRHHAEKVEKRLETMLDEEKFRRHTEKVEKRLDTILKSVAQLVAGNAIAGNAIAGDDVPSRSSL